jgi:hypothetical protein
MTATISHLPGPAGKSAAPSGLSLRKESTGISDPDRVERLIALYRRVGTVAPGALDTEDTASILRALRDGREADALALLDIALEEPEGPLDEAYAIDDELDGSPIPHIALIWRHAPKPARPRLALVGAEAHRASETGKMLVPCRSMPMEAGGDWAVTVGELDVDPVPGWATLELGIKGELFLLLHAGALTVEDSNGRVVTEVSCVAAASRLVRIVYCGARSRLANAPDTLRFVAQGDVAPQGVWYHSSRKALDERSRRSDPESCDTFFCGHFIPVAAASGTAFCEGAQPLPGRSSYKHRAGEKRGDFTRHKLGDEPLSADEGWTLDATGLSTNVIGIMAAPASSAELHHVERELVVHEGSVEVLTALDGVAWVAVAAEKADGPDDERDELFLVQPSKADGSHRAALVTPLVSTRDGGCDVMLFRPTFGHSVWMTPGTQSRVLHLSFGDPVMILPRREKAREKAPESRPVRRVARGR